MSQKTLPRKVKEPKLPITEKVDESNIAEYVRSKIGMEPNAWGSKRRWLFLRLMAKRLFEVKRVGFDDFFVWVTAHCQCMKLRTLREDYLETLERLGFVRVDWNPDSSCGEVNSHG